VKITYAENPLDTKVELEPHEIELLRLKIKLEEYEDMIYGAYFDLTARLRDMGPLKALSLEQAVEEAKKVLDPDRWIEDDSKLNKRVDGLLKHYLEELQGSHLGDCTAFPMTCSKCLAEGMLGINTFGTYPGKAVLHAIERAFFYKDGETWVRRSLDEVLAMLPPDAKAYLSEYHRQHFPTTPGDAG
jgi:hypothetical protein